MKEATTSSVVALVAFVSVTLLPWVFLWQRGEALDLRDLVAVGLIWLVIGTFAAANSPQWRKKQP